MYLHRSYVEMPRFDTILISHGGNVKEGTWLIK